jgi:hypothetical protein
MQIAATTRTVRLGPLTGQAVDKRDRASVGDLG